MRRNVQLKDRKVSIDAVPSFRLVIFTRLLKERGKGMDLIEQEKLKHVTIYRVKDFPHVAVVEATSPYIPIQEFKEAFQYIGELVVRQKITKLIFDKRKLSVFHQPSMVWYFVDWKERMLENGLTTHRKLLPADNAFRESVKIGRAKINKAYPNGKFHNMDIAYAENLEDAVTK